MEIERAHSLNWQKEGPMPYYEREEQLMNIFLQRNTVTMDELAELMFVSKPTLRRDLIKLEQKGLILRSHGTASLVKTSPNALNPFTLREQEQNQAKSTIAHKAVNYIKDGDTIMLDASTSAYHIVPLLADLRNILVITSSAKTAFLLGQMNIPNICTGGQMINCSFSYVGSDALRTISQYNADIVFFSCLGLASNGQITDKSVEENQIRRAMLHRSRKKILLCDSNKLGKTYLHNLCHVSDIDEVLCDAPLPQFPEKEF